MRQGCPGSQPHGLSVTSISPLAPFAGAPLPLNAQLSAPVQTYAPDGVGAQQVEALLVDLPSLRSGGLELGAVFGFQPLQFGESSFTSHSIASPTTIR